MLGEVDGERDCEGVHAEVERRVAEALRNRRKWRWLKGECTAPARPRRVVAIVTGDSEKALGLIVVGFERAVAKRPRGL